MFRARFAPALAAVLCAFAGAAQARDPYADYRIPDHRWSTASGTYSVDWSHDRNDTPGEQFRRGVLHSSIVTSGTWASESDQWLRQVDLFAAGQGSRQYNDGERLSGAGVESDEARSSTVEGDLALNLLLRTYPWSAPLGFTMFGHAAWQPSIDWSANDFIQSQPPNEDRQHTNQRTSDGREIVVYGAGLGFGRVRDATPVYQAQRLEEDLLSRRALTRHLHGRTREKLAAWFALQPDVQNAHERPDKYFWGEVDRILREDGALRDGVLDAYSAYRLAERGITNQLPLRRVGYFVGPTIQGDDQWVSSASTRHTSEEQLTNGVIVSSTDQRIGGHFSDHQRAFARVGATAEYHRPFGERWQLDAQSAATYSAGNHLLNAGTVLQLEFMLADRWLALAAVGHDAAALEEPHTGRVLAWTAATRAEVHYVLEDRWSLSAAFVTQEDHDATGDDQRQAFQLGVSRWFSGLLSAPGVVPSLRRL